MVQPPTRGFGHDQGEGPRAPGLGSTFRPWTWSEILGNVFAWVILLLVLLVPVFEAVCYFLSGPVPHSTPPR